MLFNDTYKTISAPAEGVFRDRGSKFIGYAFPIRTEAEAKEQIQQLRDAHTKARHFCTALRLTPDRSVFRINDDGEPAGTGGRPILNALLSADVTNVLIVVVRYFGGTLLGVPGLINAYRTAASEALAAALVEERTVNDIYRFEFDYLQMNPVMRLVKEENLHILEQVFDNQCSMDIEVRQTATNRLLSRVAQIDGLKVVYCYSV
ncbi:YigZ family protein [Pedobacter yulinensis]|uniref:YigZ family protein n=1 Tax=Pedobacter yulinensis TaxID=2126353 RepID=A0A2T3HKV0_9SPHI|nr:YigZ family protein [Pedobacter yulinensis]PST83039.1 YigZ family protein [Pedobacter yulinensis]